MSQTKLTALLPNIDEGGLLEFSVVYTDRALNHMSKKFGDVMRGISANLKKVYNASAVILVPGGGTFGMESVARQFAAGQKVMVLRNGFFSYRWSQILETGQITPAENISVLCAAPISNSPTAPWQPSDINTVLEAIKKEKPAVIFMPHVETASGIILPDEYIKQIGRAAREIGALLVLDCIASGALWVDMKDAGVDVLISAPQKTWSSEPCAAMVCLSEKAIEKLESSQGSSFALDLKKWHSIMKAHESGAHAYHATMPTMAIANLNNAINQTFEFGLEKARDKQIQLGQAVRQLLAARGFPSVAASGYEASGVVVSYTTDAEIQNGKKFAAIGVQSAAGVPLMCGETAEFRTFRLGLFGLDKLIDVPACVQRLEAALDNL